MDGNFSFLKTFMHGKTYKKGEIVVVQKDARDGNSVNPVFATNVATYRYYKVSKDSSVLSPPGDDWEEISNDEVIMRHGIIPDRTILLAYEMVDWSFASAFFESNEVKGQELDVFKCLVAHWTFLYRSMKLHELSPLDIDFYESSSLIMTTPGVFHGSVLERTQYGRRCLELMKKGRDAGKGMSL